MQLLVSVRDAVEAREAVAAGADIVDAKEPALGALAPVSPGALAAIVAVLAPGTALSVAFGEPADGDALAAVLAARAGALGDRPAFLKFVPPTRRAGAVAGMVAVVRRAAPRARVIVAGYADRLAPTELAAFVHGAADAGADGVLLDTAGKGSSLLARCAAEDVEGFVAAAHDRGLLAALAGSLALEDLSRIAALGADVAGVRGAACEGGRAGRLSAARVTRLLQAAHAQLPPVPTAQAW
ncbi:MAG TPA: (5-formylfuran-3-yl)methyl phosphate synthase [Gemmatimonadales bacterium]|nr:(5-formylfuran-3-yl)methyl phosphate synthase [Gemmatimonadales bacterium]